MADDALDLEHMLLAAAGRKSGSNTNASSGAASKRDGKRSSRRGSSSSSDEDEEEDEDDYDKKGKGGSKMPLKKRFDGGDRDEGSGSDLSFGSDLYKDDEDKRKLEAMTELEREMILHERSEKRDNYSLKKSTEARIAEEERKRDGPPSSRMRSSGRETTKTSKTNALSELVAKRQRSQDASQLQQQHQHQHQHQHQQRKRREHVAGGAAAPPPRRSASPSSNSDADSEDDDDEESSRGESNRSDVPSEDDDDERGGRVSLPDNEDIRKITIRRSKLSKWFMEPFFEEVIVGCFVRIGIGMSNSGTSMYRLCLVKNVDATEPDKPYKFENRTTHKYLNCTWGDDSSAARWQMVRASDQAPTDDEIDAWKAEVAKSDSPGISKSAVRDKAEALEKIASFVYSAAAVKQMLQEKKMASARPSNLALEKERVMKELSVAEGKGDQEQIERLHEKLKELESLASKQQTKNEKAERIEMMNRRNRFENFKNASELKPAAKMGEAGYDPFSRRWTRSQNYYKSDAPKTAAEEHSEAIGGDKAGKDGAGFLQELTKAGNGRLMGRQFSKMFSLHDFDLPISLAALERFKGGQGAAMAFMERKRKMEAHYGVRVDDDDGRRHSLTLTVNDYKRRRGLL
ncbi:protein RTF1 homolog [Selaginella moellendorffii]|nr:protein RTF1 homolog [Selaginella moellendorffii]|eukprot:XP_002989964.2 protein RTF1 homolog [Selaginella moellendorffii]